MAAYKHKINTVLIPKANEPDISEIDTAVKENVNFIPVESFSEVLMRAIAEPVKVSEHAWNHSSASAKSAAVRTTIRQ